MPKINLDLTEAVSNKPIDLGVYEMEVESISEVKQGAKAAYVTIVWNCVEEPFVGRKVYDNRPVNGKGASLFADFYAKVTGEDVDVDDLDSLDIDTDDLVGQSALVTIGHREYNGETQHEVSKLSRV